MDNDTRDYFDKQTDWVIDRLPEHFTKLMETVPLLIDDRPPQSILRDMRINDPTELCGLFVGESMATRLHQHSVPSTVFLFRAGIIALTESIVQDSIFSSAGRKELRVQIETTILHEFAHYHGLNEKDVRLIGYE